MKFYLNIAVCIKLKNNGHDIEECTMFVKIHEISHTYISPSFFTGAN